MPAPAFPPGFLWGVATSSQQIEGAAYEDGRSESIWDRFAATPGTIEDGSDTRVACDHYHRWREDVALMKWLGLGAYRFSIAWPRVLPAGRGAVNEAGLDFYDALVDALLSAGIVPFPTLYHWDLPQVLQDEGGWGSRDTAAAFTEFAGVVGARLGDRVRHWITHNEPSCVAGHGHEQGVHAPGHRDPAEALCVAHHVLLSHGWAMQVLRQRSPGAAIGISLQMVPAEPATSSAADRDAARQADGAANRWYLDPLFLGRYPEDAIADRVRRGHLPSLDLPFVRAGDLQAIAAPMDFLGVNYYGRTVVRAGDDGTPVGVPVVPLEERTAMGWEVYPQGLEDLLAHLAREYPIPPLYITENGAAFDDAVGPGRRIADPRRIDFLRGHLLAAARAIDAGVPLRGFFIWSLLDNFEWSCGYTKRFGLCWVDFATQERIPKDSAYWYREVVAANAIRVGSPLSTPGRLP